jgi:hypothetical protein
VIEIPVDDFVGDANRRDDTWMVRGERRQVPHFLVDGHRIWGATAMILAELAAIWQEIRIQDPDPDALRGWSRGEP